MRGDLLDLHVGLAPCVIGYGEIANRLAAQPAALEESNPYRIWVTEYAGEEYQKVATAARRTLDELASRCLTEQRFPNLLKIFRQATRLEADFWQMGLTLAD